MVLDAFVRALTFYGGVPRRVIIDNPKTKVTYVSRSKDRVFHPRFLALPLGDCQQSPAGQGEWRLAHRICWPRASHPAAGQAALPPRGSLTTALRQLIDAETVERQVRSICQLTGDDLHRREANIK